MTKLAADSSVSNRSHPGGFVLQLRRGVRLVHDPATNRSMLLSPERGLVLGPTAEAVVRLLDGTRDLDTVVATLIAQFSADRRELELDVSALASDLLRLRLVSVRPPA
jgi:coenzyme PQQ biosynthesis protein PqqD